MIFFLLLKGGDLWGFFSLKGNSSFSFFPFWFNFEGWIWVLIASVPDLCIRFTFLIWCAKILKSCKGELKTTLRFLFLLVTLVNHLIINTLLTWTFYSEFAEIHLYYACVYCKSDFNFCSAYTTQNEFIFALFCFVFVLFLLIEIILLGNNFILCRFREHYKMLNW